MGAVKIMAHRMDTGQSYTNIQGVIEIIGGVKIATKRRKTTKRKTYKKRR